MDLNCRDLQLRPMSVLPPLQHPRWEREMSGMIKWHTVFIFISVYHLSYFWRAPSRDFGFMLVGLWLGSFWFFLLSGLFLLSVYGFYRRVCIFAVGLWFFIVGLLFCCRTFVKRERQEIVVLFYL